MADQRRFESQSLLSEGYAEMGLYGLHSATTRLAVVTLVQQGAPLDGLRLTDWRDEYQHWQTPLLSAYLDDRGRGIVEAVARAADGLGWSPLEVALVWVRDRPGITAPIVGARTAAQLDGALGVEDLTLPAEIVEALDDVSTD